MKIKSFILTVFLCGGALAANFVPPSFRVLQAKTTVDWNKIIFCEFVEWMRDDVGWNVVVRWDALATEGVDGDTVVTVKLREVPVSMIVDEVLRQVSPDITYHLTEHAMVLSSRADFNKDMYVRSYDLTDLVVQFSPLDEPPPTDLRFMSKGTSVGTSSFEEQTEQDDVEEIKLQIERAFKSLKPNTWENFGGEGTLYWLGNTIVVRNIIEVHELIAGSLY